MEQTFTPGLVAKTNLAPVSDLLGQAWEVYKKKFKIFLEVYLRGLVGMAPFFIVLALMALVSILVTDNSLKLTLNVVLGVLATVTFLGFIYYAVRTQVGIMLYFERSEVVPTKEVFNETKNYFWRFLGVTLLSALFILLWTLLLIIPGVIFSIYYTFATMVFLFEGLAGRAALKRSQQLVKGYWWAVLGRLLFLALIYFVINMILSIPNIFWSPNSVPSALWNGFLQVINFLIGPWFGVYSYLVYKNLVNIKSEPTLNNVKAV